MVMRGALFPTSSCSTMCETFSLTRAQWGKYGIKEAFTSTIHIPYLNLYYWLEFKSLCLSLLCYVARDWFSF